MNHAINTLDLRPHLCPDCGRRARGPRSVCDCGQTFPDTLTERSRLTSLDQVRKVKRTLRIARAMRQLDAA